MIYFSIPDFWHMHKLNCSLIQLIANEPNKFYNDIKIASTFGCFPCIWNGGRMITGEVNDKIIYDYITFYNNNGISVRHTFTNSLLQSDDFYDHMGNMICRISEELGTRYNITNSCIINNDTLGEFIKNKYPKLNIIYSTTKELQIVELINKYSENNLIIPSYNINHNFELLKQLKYPQNIELLCIEDGCIAHCNNRKQHQECISKVNLNEDFIIGGQTFTCPMGIREQYWYGYYNNPEIFITPEEMRNEYAALGFNQFKISGRGNMFYNIINNIESYITYFVKPEYSNIIRNKLLIDNLNTYKV